MGGNLITAKHGLARLQLNPEQPFDVVLMDIQMPEMDGIHNVKEIWKLEKQTNIFTPSSPSLPMLMTGIKPCAWNPGWMTTSLNHSIPAILCKSFKNTLAKVNSLNKIHQHASAQSI